MNTENKVFNKLFSNEKVELASQKYEFVKKVPDIAKEIAKIENIATKAALKMNDMRMSYLKEYQNFIGAMSESEKLTLTAEGDLNEVRNSLVAIGMDGKDAEKITGFKPAIDKVSSLKDYTKKMRSLYNNKV